MQQVWSWLRQNEIAWIIDVFVVVFVTLLAVYAVSLLFARLEIRFQMTKNLWDDALFAAVRKPLRWLILLLGLGWAADIAAQYADTSLIDVLEPVRKIGLIVILTWFMIRVVRAVEERLRSNEYAHKPMDHTTAAALGRLLRGAIVITSILVVMQSMGYSISSVLAFGGIGGLAIGFAAKDLLSNFFGGMMI